MAVVRARSSPPYGAFAGFFLFGITAVLAVIFYIMWAKAVDEVDSAGKKQSADAIQLKTTKDALEAKVKELTTVTSDRETKASQINNFKRQADEATRRADEAEKASKATATEMQSARQGFSSSVSTINDQVVKLNAEVADANRRRDEAVAKGQDDLTRRRLRRKRRCATRSLKLNSSRATSRGENRKFLNFAPASPSKAVRAAIPTSARPIRPSYA